MYGLGFFREGIVLNNDLHGETKKDVVDYSFEWVHAIYFLAAICGSKS